MCTKSNVFENDSNKEGVFSVIKAKSFERAQSFVSKHVEEKEEVLQTLGKVRKLIEEHRNNEPQKDDIQPIKVVLCVNKFCVTVLEFLKDIDIEIRIEINF